MTKADESNTARQAILSSIHEHLSVSGRFDAQFPHQPTAEESVRSREDRCDGTITKLFQQALEAVSGHCSIVRNIDEAARAIREIIDERKAKCIAVSDGTLVKEALNRLDTEAVLLNSPSQSELFDCDLGLTTAQWAIAETGTLVLESERERNRLATLVPPVHVAIIEANRIRRTMAEILELVKNSEVGLSRAVTFITGPSRTSDIELTLAIGVHGPGELHVIVIDDVSQTG